MLHLDREGYVTAYLVTEPSLTPFEAPYALTDQLAFEREMRGLFYREPTGCPVAPRLGELAPNGLPWRFYADNRNPYVDFSTFYFTLQYVTFFASTTLVVDSDCDVRVRVWSYAAFDLWQGERHIATERVPVYQPIRHTDLTLSLVKGENPLFFCIQNFGVRDTRNMLSLQILDTKGVTTALPIENETLCQLLAAEEFFFGMHVREGCLEATVLPPMPITVELDGKKSLWTKKKLYPIGETRNVRLSGELFGQKFERTLECREHSGPSYRARECDDPVLDNARQILSKITERDELGYVFTGGHMAPHSAFAHALIEGKLGPDDHRAIRDGLAKIRERVDCSDFALSCIFYLLLTYGLPAELAAELRDTALAFRYWMDENGADAMCFWSENHALLFHTCQLIAGRLYPDDTFLRSGRTGREQEAIGRRRVHEWFDTVLREGFEEFCAGGYMSATCFALLLVHDHGDPDMKPRARAVLDTVARQAVLQSFRGMHLSPMGRIYRTALTPYASGLQALLHMIDDTAPDKSDVWAIPRGVSDYRLPEGLRELMHSDADEVFSSGRAEIHTKKTADYMLTSVASPRTTPLPEPPATESEYDRTKILNEGFHGTTLFVPGVGGYQQHLWYAALSDRFYTFVNLPGSNRDFSGMRPGYWFGNLIFPSLRQIGGELYCHYAIPESVPTSFTHAYFPAFAADEVVLRDGFRFARVGDGYLALWCSSPLRLWENDAVLGADLRAYSRDVAWYVALGSASEHGSFKEFMSLCAAKKLSLASVKEVLCV